MTCIWTPLGMFITFLIFIAMKKNLEILQWICSSENLFYWRGARMARAVRYKKSSGALFSHKNFIFRENNNFAQNKDSCEKYNHYTLQPTYQTLLLRNKKYVQTLGMQKFLHKKFSKIKKIVFFFWNSFFSYFFIYVF